MKKFWVYTGSDAIGPFAIDEIRRCVPGFGPDTLIAPDGATGQTDWKPAEQFPDLLPVLQAPAAIPKMPANWVPRSRQDGLASLPDKSARSARSLGVIAYESKDYRKAVEYLDKALEVDAQDAEALFYRGMAGLHGLLGESRGHWWEALSLIINEKRNG